MEYEHLLYTVSDQTAIVTLNRPKAWNALCGALNTELESAIRLADGDPAVRAHRPDPAAPRYLQRARTSSRWPMPRR